MLKTHKSSLRGMFIGDSHLRISSLKLKTATLNIKHSIKQKEYFLYKLKYLENALGREIRYLENTTLKGYPYIVCSVTHNYFYYCYKWLYKPKKKMTLTYLRKVSNEGIAFWYMDDGSLYAKKRNGKPHAYELVFSTCCSKQEAEDCIKFFKERFDVDFTLKYNKNLYSIRCGTTNARKFLDQIQQFIPDCMAYKTF